MKRYLSILFTVYLLVGCTVVMVDVDRVDVHGEVLL